MNNLSWSVPKFGPNSAKFGDPIIQRLPAPPFGVLTGYHASF